MSLAVKCILLFFFLLTQRVPHGVKNKRGQNCVIIYKKILIPWRKQKQIVNVNLEFQEKSKL